MQAAVVTETGTFESGSATPVTARWLLEAFSNLLIFSTGLCLLCLRICIWLCVCVVYFFTCPFPLQIRTICLCPLQLYNVSFPLSLEIILLLNPATRFSWIAYPHSWLFLSDRPYLCKWGWKQAFRSFDYMFPIPTSSKTKTRLVYIFQFTRILSNDDDVQFIPSLLKDIDHNTLSEDVCLYIFSMDLWMF